MNLSTPIEQIPRVGPQYQKKLRRLGIKTIGQLIFHFPHRYEDFSNVIPISQVQKGETVSIKGKLTDIKNIRTFRKRMVVSQPRGNDESGSLQVMWFNQPYLINTLKKGDVLFLAGKMNQKNGKYLSCPAYEKIQNGILENSDMIHTARLVPVYPETEGLSSRWLRNILWPILKKLSREKSVPTPISLETIKDFVESLPFKLTDDQRKSAWQILKDIEKKRPMNRLLEGDVGSGKTVGGALAR